MATGAAVVMLVVEVVAEEEAVTAVVVEEVAEAEGLPWRSFRKASFSYR